MNSAPKVGLASGQRIIGYFTADDEDVTIDAQRALGFESLAAAEAEAARLNATWSLAPGERFVGMAC